MRISYTDLLILIIIVCKFSSTHKYTAGQYKYNGALYRYLYINIIGIYIYVDG